MELVLPMYTNFSPKKFGQKCTHYTWQNMVIHRNKCREAAKLRRQRYMTQMKEQNKTLEKKLKKKKERKAIY